MVGGAVFAGVTEAGTVRTELFIESLELSTDPHRGACYLYTDFLVVGEDNKLVHGPGVCIWHFG